MKNNYLKFLITLLAFIAFELRSQDILILKNGDEIQSKVLEVTSTELKYKRYDNPDGPVYRINKSEVFMVKYENGTKDVFGMEEQPKAPGSGYNVVNPSIPTGKVYFLRQTPSSTSIIGYEIFIDEKSVCKLNNNMYSVHELPPGEHTFSVQFFGRTPKTKAEKLSIDIEPGMSYYIEVSQNSKVYDPDVFCVKMSEQAGRHLLGKLEEDEDCL